MSPEETAVSERAEAALKTNAEAYRLAQEAFDMRAENGRLHAAMKDVLDALAIVRHCAHDRLGEIGGDCTTYEDAFRKLEIACAALLFIEEYVEAALR
jgi:hypothetical protein